MARKKYNPVCCQEDSGSTCCRVDAVVTIDSRGQMVLPKGIRARAGIKADDKIALICFEKDGKIHCISMVKVENFNKSVKTMLEPMVEEISRED